MKRLFLISGILSLLLFGAWGCPEKSEQSKQEFVGSAEIVGQKSTDTVETTQAGAPKATEVTKEKAKRVIEELQVTPQSSTEETKGSE
jgi:hypothetical protein